MIKQFAKFIVCQGYRIRFKRFCSIAPSCVVLGDCKFEGGNKLADKTYFRDSTLGYKSYIGTGCEFNKTRIGRYTSIGNNVVLVTGTHPVNNVISTHPAFYASISHSDSYVKDFKFDETLTDENGNCAVIGNDVWIGNNVLIRGGVSIGDGAIIGMGAVVTKDIPPYAIAAGVPARIIRYRFSNEDINKLLQLKWWDKPQEWIIDHAEDFSNAEMFLKENNTH